MAEIIWLDPATFSLEEIIEYIAFDNPDAAARLTARTLRHIAHLSKHPKIGPAVPDLPQSEHRQIIEPPCRIFYKISGDTIFIVHVMRSERLFRPSNLQDVE